MVNSVFLLVMTVHLPHHAAPVTVHARFNDAIICREWGAHMSADMQQMHLPNTWTCETARGT